MAEGRIVRKLKPLLVLTIAIIFPLAACEAPEPPAETTQTTPGPRTSSGEPSPEAADTPSPEVATGPSPVETPAPHVEAVVTSNELATGAGVEILAAGGSAADASVAVAAVLSVVEPFYSSVLGGGTWALYYDADGREVTSMNGVGPVGSEATLSDYRPRAGSPGMHQAIVPGAWDGWMLWLEEYGELELGEVLAPAIAVAREGYPVSTEMSFWLTSQEGRIRNSPVMASIYLPDGDLLAPGETVHQTDMADTFESLVAAYDDAVAEGHGAGIAAARDHFYRGPIADAIVSFSEENGGYLTEQDFAGFSAELVEPISIEYDELRVYQNPPNSQGIDMLEALNILEGFDFAGQSASDADVVHRQVEAIKLAYADRYEFVGDPDRVDVPVSKLLSDDYAANQRERIDPDSAASWPIESGLDRQATDTTTFHITDSVGDAAAVTTSLGGQYLVVGDTGIHINERMNYMSVDEDNVNVVAPGATVRHTSNPYMVLRDGIPYLMGGNTGIDTQPQGQLQQFMNVVEFGMSAQEAAAQARFVSTAFPASNYPYAVDNTLQVEAGFSNRAVNSLGARGHNVVVGAGIFGTANMIVVTEDGADAQVGVEPRNETASGVVRPVD